MRKLLVSPMAIEPGPRFPAAFYGGALLLLGGYWVIEALVHAFVFPEAKFLDGLFSLNAGELATRLPAIFLIAVFFVVDRIQQNRSRAAGVETATKYRRLVELAHDGIWLIDSDAKTLFANTRMAEMLSRAPREMLGQPLAALAGGGAEGTIRDRVLRRPGGGGAPGEVVTGLETILERSDGGSVIASVSATVFGDGPEESILLTVRDVTEARRAEQQIRASLEEKEILLREVHHRVKNNLHIVSTLLNLQFSGIPDPATRKALENSQSRVRAMALIQEQLFRSSTYGHVDFRTYTERLISSIFGALGIGEGAVRLSIEVDDVALPIDAAIPCGLILNELVSNSLKHAFRDGGAEGIDVRLRRGEGELLELRVGDDGPGLPAGVDFEKAESLGFDLVRILVRQLRGTIARESGSGCVFTVTFPSPIREERVDS
jgi:PAS domain S-box-containing protein